ncbi:MAG: hypothetical protein H0A76_00195 [Candidatus Thiodubiliella endoseptemdiera]|uniref:Uncharacterized protein n=1 Tax=Candidatus Thiodubiliella endoseptemdiera TaxID=2738886 RepID=A0A853EZ31_9GAMM|nr:hypothetical protein [Candidatus Thiodubiliella endoseptemdiera]
MQAKTFFLDKTASTTAGDKKLLFKYSVQILGIALPLQTLILIINKRYYAK